MSKTMNSFWGAGRVSFLSHQSTIKNYLDAGWSKRAIFRQLNLAHLSYPQFTRYIGRYLTSPPQPTVEAQKAPLSAPAPAPLISKPPVQTAQPQFKFNPQAPDKDALI